MTNEAKTHIGVYGICRDPKGRLLLVRISGGPDKGNWVLPGGGIEWGEDPKSALIREMEEETGITDIRSFAIRDTYSHPYSASEYNHYTAMHHLGILYELEIGSFTLRDEEDGTTDHCEWFSEQDARALPLAPLGAFAIKLVWDK